MHPDCDVKSNGLLDSTGMYNVLTLAGASHTTFYPALVALKVDRESIL